MQTLQRTSGISAQQLSPGSGLRRKDYKSLLLTSTASVVTAFAMTEDTAGVYQAAAVANGRVNYPSTLCARVNQTGSPTTGSFRIRVKGLDFFGNYIEEESPVIAISAKANNWIYLAKVFSVVLAVDYQDDGLASVELSVGQRFDWVRTVDANNDHVAPENLGIGLPLDMQFTPYPVTNKFAEERFNLIPQRNAALSLLVIAGTQPAVGETVTIDGITYTFQTTLASAYDVSRGASAADCADNLRRAINLDGVAGTNYHAGTGLHPTVRAESSGVNVSVFAKHPGSAGNLIALAETMAGVGNAWTSATLQGGYDDNGEVIGVMARDIGGTIVNVPRSQFVVGQTADGWTGTIEKLGFQASIGSYATGDSMFLNVSMLSRAYGY